MHTFRIRRPDVAADKVFLVLFFHKESSFRSETMGGQAASNSGRVEASDTAKKIDGIIPHTARNSLPNKYLSPVNLGQ
jgi:hypothetical protein